jgi:hypothetical protein
MTAALKSLNRSNVASGFSRKFNTALFRLKAEATQ